MAFEREDKANEDSFEKVDIDVKELYHITKPQPNSVKEEITAKM